MRLTQTLADLWNSFAPIAWMPAIGMSRLVDSPNFSTRTFSEIEGGGGRQMILIVEDNERLAHLFSRYLREHMGRQVEVVNDGATAIAALTSKPYELAIIDLALSDAATDGIDVAIRARAGGSGVPMIAISGAAKRIHDTDMQPAGFVASVAKPLLMTELQALVEQHAIPATFEGTPK